MRRTWFDWLMLVCALGGLLVAGIAIGVPIIRDKKELTVDLFSRTRLSDNFSDASNGRIKILVSGKPVEDFTILQFRISSTGKKAIESSDYEGRPIKIDFADASDVQYVSTTETEPKGLSPILSFSHNQISFEPFGLNPGAFFVLEAGILHKRHQKPQPQILGQIIGAKIILQDTSTKPISVKSDWWAILPILPIVLSLLFSALSLVARYYVRDRVRTESRYLPGVPSLLKWFIANDKTYAFFSVKFLREKVFAKDPEMLNALQFSIDVGLLNTYKVPNPKHPTFPVTAVQINRSHPLFKELLTE